ncbi:lipocalin-15-like [Mustelus asterias]
MVALTALLLLAACLVGSLGARPPACKMLKPRNIVMNASTFAGKWYLQRWATQYEPYRREFSKVDSAFIINTPVLQMNKTLINVYMRLGNDCISEMEAYHLSNNGLEFTCESRPYMVLRILNIKNPNFLLFHIQERREGKMCNTISLYSRNATGMDNMLKTFEEQIQCAGMKKDKVVVPPRKKNECDEHQTETDGAGK